MIRNIEILVAKLAAIFAVLLIASSAYAEGWVDVAQQDRFSGWACNKGSDERVDIHLWRDDGVFLGAGNARLYREQGVQSACGSSDSYHGFDIQILLNVSWLDGKKHKVSVYLVSASGNKQLNNSPVTVQFGTPTPTASPPTIAGAVVGRDLNVPGLGFFGHIGLWDGEKVIEALNEGGTNKLKQSNWGDFTNRTPVWAHAYPDYPSYRVRGCFERDCNDSASLHLAGAAGYFAWSTISEKSIRQAVVKRAYQAYLIGAGYTLAASSIISTASRTSYTTDHCNPYGGGACVPLRVYSPSAFGLYRCDSFVIESVANSTYGNGIQEFAVQLNGSQNDVNRENAWKSKVGNLVYAVRNPYNIISMMRAM